MAGTSKEKLAYGLLLPFIAHMRSAKDQISGGSYSVTLRPPNPAVSTWFTKATLQRFVRFVSTPEILERTVTIEKEIAQLDNSIRSYKAFNGDNGDFGGDNEGNGTAVGATSLEKENPKVRLQRVVQTRKLVLRKEQAMVYARALAAGFEMDNLDDLLCFSDAFGASRLREACINFKDLSKKKFEDRVWVDEIAAMQSMIQPDLSYMETSGIILAEHGDPAQSFMMTRKQNCSTNLSDSTASHGSSDTNQENLVTPPTGVKMEVPNPCVSQFPSYMRNFQGPVYQKMPPYRAYVYPGMQVASPYYPPNADHESHDNKRSSRKKGKSSFSKEHEEQNCSSESKGDSSETEFESSSERLDRKKHGNKSSRKVVIHNINYISPKRDGENNSASSEIDSSDENGYINGDSLKRQLEDVLGSFGKHFKPSTHHHRKRKESKLHNALNEKDASPKNKSNKGNENLDSLQQLLLRDELDSNTPGPHQAKFEEEHLVKSRSNRRPYSTDAFLVIDKNTGYNGNTANCVSDNFDPNENFVPNIRKGTTSEELLFSQQSEEPEGFARVSLLDDATRSTVMRRKTSDDLFGSKNSNDRVNHVRYNQITLVDDDFVTSSVDQVEKKRKDVIIDDSLMIQGQIIDDRPESQLMTSISLTDIVVASLVESDTSNEPQKKSESVGFHEPDDIYMGLDRKVVVEQVDPRWTPEMDFENSFSHNPPAKSYSDVDVNSKGPSNRNNGDSTIKASGEDSRSRTLGGSLRKGKIDTTPAIRRSTFGSKTTTPKNRFAEEEERRKRTEELILQRKKRIAERSAIGGDKLLSSRKPQSASKPVTTSLNSSIETVKKLKPILKTSTKEQLTASKTTPKPPTPATKKVSFKLNDGSKNNIIKTRSSEKKADSYKAKGTTDEQVGDFKDIKELHVIHPMPESLDNAPASIFNIEEKGSINEKNHGSFEISEIEEWASRTPISVLHPIQSRKKQDGTETSLKAPKGLKKLFMFGRKG